MGKVSFLSKLSLQLDDEIAARRIAGDTGFVKVSVLVLMLLLVINCVAAADDSPTADNILSRPAYDAFDDVTSVRSSYFVILPPLSPDGYLSFYIVIRNSGKTLTKPSVYYIHFLWSVKTPTLSENSEVVFLADETRVKTTDPQKVKVSQTPHIDGIDDITNEELDVPLTPEDFKTLSSATKLRLRISGKEEQIPDGFQNYCKILYEASQGLPNGK